MKWIDNRVDSQEPDELESHLRCGRGGLLARPFGATPIKLSLVSVGSARSNGSTRQKPLSRAFYKM